MKTLLTGLFTCCIFLAAQAQNTFKAIIRSGHEQTPLPGATVTWQQQNQSYTSDSSGNVTILNIPNGTQTFMVSHVGFEATTLSFVFPLASDSVMVITLAEGEQEHEEEVRVTATRTSRTIANTPTRIEVISGEELDEKANMKPGDIRMLLSESTGIQTQQTSATSYNSSIRIQGLDGRYTQILRDGYPLYSGFSGGLSIMQIAPLDLKQVEVIKGSSSTLYGGGAIAGLVNLVSKTPTDERELQLMANGTSARGLDVSGFYSERYGKIGLTIFGSRNTSSAYDPADIGFTAIPKFERYTINPRLFVYGNKTTMDVGLSYITEDRVGGSMEYIEKGTPGYFEKNNTDRLTTQLGISHRLSEHAAIYFKNSFTRFDRQITIPSYQFAGLQQSTFSELTFQRERNATQWIVGANVLTDGFREEVAPNTVPRNYHYDTYGVFIQNEWSPTSSFTLESGLRGDYVSRYGFELLPRISALFRISPAFTTRIGGGSGYKVPTIFTEEGERMQFVRILPIDQATSRNERSLGGNWDVNYKTTWGPVGLSINQLFFYTRLNKPLVLNAAGNDFQFRNANGHIDTKGLETNLKLTYGDFKLFVGYTFADVASHFDGKQTWMPLNARHRLNNVLMYEKEEKWKVGLEAYYVSKQQLSDGRTGKPYWITGFMAERLWEKLSLFLNFENFTDTRQTRWESIYTGSIDNPVFRDIYAPVEGRVINGGFKVKL